MSQTGVTFPVTTDETLPQSQMVGHEKEKNRISNENKLKMVLKRVTTRDGSVSFVVQRNHEQLTSLNQSYNRQNAKDSVYGSSDEQSVEAGFSFDGNGCIVELSEDYSDEPLEKSSDLSNSSVGHSSLAANCPATMALLLVNGHDSSQKAPMLKQQPQNLSQEMELVQKKIAFQEIPHGLDHFTTEYFEIMKKRFRLIKFWPLPLHQSTTWLLDEKTVKGLDFFPDSQFNQELAQFLIRFNLRTVLYLTSFVFFGYKSFNKYYLPSGDHLSPEELRQPQPNYKLFLAFGNSLKLNAFDSFGIFIEQNNKEFLHSKYKQFRWLRSLEANNQGFFDGRDGPFDIFDLVEKEKRQWPSQLASPAKSYMPANSPFEGTETNELVPVHFDLPFIDGIFMVPLDSVTI